MRSSLITHLLLVLALMLAAGFTTHNKIMWRWDQLIYDAELSFWQRQVSDDIIIVTIDDQSLHDLGRWPWPRSVHAELVRKIDASSPRAIALDIIFSEPDRTDSLSDVLLARAIRASGKVVLPVYMSTTSKGSVPVEALPLPEFTQNVAALGHVHVDIDDDGIARRVFLREGIGKPHWNHYSIAILQVAGEPPDVNLSASSEDYSALQWYREHPYLVPFSGPPGTFRQIGYSQVLSGEYPADLFEDKIVLVGATAEGMVDAFPTPVSGDGGAMPGVEIVANVIQGLRDGVKIVTVERPWLTLISMVLVGLPMLLYRIINPSRTLLMLFAVIAATIVIDAVLLWLAGVWVAISTVVLFQLLSYPLWSWGRLVTAMRFMNEELDRLEHKQRELSVKRGRDIADEISFISAFIPLSGWILLDKDENIIQQHGIPPENRLAANMERRWSVDGNRYWAALEYHGSECQLGLNLDAGAFITDEEHRLLDSLIDPKTEAHVEHAASSDHLQRRIDQLREIGDELESLRAIVDSSLAGMADGIVICDSHGIVLLANRRASWYLYGDDYLVLDGKSILELLSHLQIVNNGQWQPGIIKAMLDRQRVILEAVHKDGRDLMVEMSPLTITDDTGGLIINFSDTSMLKASERKRDESLSFLSHDLRAPLSSMMAMIELARNRQDVTSIHGMLDDMRTNTDKTMYLAEQFLQLSRATTTTKIQFHDVDFNSVVMNAVDQLWAAADSQGITIEQQFDSEDCWTLADADLMERAIVNLLTNAIKHSDAGDVVRVEVSRNQDTISCCVIDHGTGIDIDELPHLFEMFRRTRESSRQSRRGTGLGLAFVDAVARRHSGHVDVESAYGEGSRFCLKIPIREDNQTVV